MAILPDYNRWIARAIGAEPSPWWHWSIAFFSSLVLLLPATAAMGATLPAMERLSSTLSKNTETLPLLYANNTLGAVFGTLLTTFLIIPELGHSQTLVLLVSANLVCALISYSEFRHIQPNTASTITTTALHFPRWRLLITLFVTGFLGIGYEILMVRLLSQVLENTVYTFASVLAIYLLGVALGAALYHRLDSQHKRTNEQWQRWLVYLLTLTALGMAVGVTALYSSDYLYRSLLERFGGVLAELVVAVTVFLFPTLAMGALFSHLAQLAQHSVGLGKALGFNTLGAALAPFTLGVLLLPTLGAKLLMVLLLISYVLCFPPRRSYIKFAMPVLASALLLWMAPPLRFISMQADSEVVDYSEGVMAAVAVVNDSSGNRHLKVNNHFTMGGTATRFSDHRQSHLPLLLHGAPRSALYLGLGTGVSMEAARFYPQLETTGVDLIPETLDMMHWFGVDPQAMQWQPPPRLLAADARRYVLSTEQQYDVIIGEIFHPSRDGAGSLYTQEHFNAIRERLAPGGVYGQWLPLFQLDLDTLKIIVRTFLEVYPGAQLYLGHFSLQQPILCLVGTEEAIQYEANWLYKRVLDPRLQQELVKERLNSDLALFGGYLAGAMELRRFVGDGPINTDNHPLVSYTAPRFVYSDQAAPASRLLQLLNQLKTDSDSLLRPDPANRQFAKQLTQYWQARDLYLKAGMEVSSGDDVAAIVQHTRGPLLQALSISSDFDPAYRALLGTAQALSQTDRYSSYQMLSELIQLVPQRREAKHLRLQLFGH